ncbi:plastid division protein PDV2 isoform X1 [Neltuma alba]|uniref:plastid division protein PDV2 isoform X1 n=1 Tax=Neltuma alba TaxID=207710 RepID=UPI0010A38F2E|nr:plastid division protein PDV2-like isoform X1 [Prosopis alba]
MEDEGIGLVLARATELRLKISNCIHRASPAAYSPTNGPLTTEPPDGNEVNDPEDDDNDEEAERLLNICDALESLENQLSSLQVLQHQQQYEREVALSEIEQSRKTLIDKLKEYKGKELEVIREASTFASETVEHNNDLLLPPYPSRPPYTMMHNSVCNGLIPIDPKVQSRKSVSEKEQNHAQDGVKNARKGLGFFVTSAAKTVLTVVGVVSVMSLSGFGPKKLGTNLNILGLLHRPESEDERSKTRCPPGRIPLVEDGEVRCVVKERVEVPFSAIAAKPDINYGCG